MVNHQQVWVWWIFGIDGCVWIEVELLGKYVDLYNKCLTLELHMLINVDIYIYTCYMQILYIFFSPQPRCSFTVDFSTS